jgi:hypothetical protein
MRTHRGELTVSVAVPVLQNILCSFVFFVYNNIFSNNNSLLIILLLIIIEFSFINTLITKLAI